MWSKIEKNVEVAVVNSQKSALVSETEAYFRPFTTATSTFISVSTMSRLHSVTSRYISLYFCHKVKIKFIRVAQKNGRNNDATLEEEMFTVMVL